MKDATSLLRSATRRAKSDVANKLISMFLHELSRTVSRGWSIRVDGEAYAELVRSTFNNRCPYCNIDLLVSAPVVEHLDGMNRLRVGLHVPGNVLVSCKRCNNEKRRDDSLLQLSLASTGWESFLSHDGGCAQTCRTCVYWRSIWPDDDLKISMLTENLRRIREFRSQFRELEPLRTNVAEVLPMLVGKLYSDCQSFATQEIASLLLAFAAQPGKTEQE